MAAEKKSFAQQSFVEIEHDILAYWKQENTFAAVQKHFQDQPPYWYYDGPPFATGLPHHGHLLASTIKDIVPRYFEMQGHHVPRHFGWDCHGVPIEHAIDKDLGLSTQEAIAKLGLAGYNDACRGIVDKYASQWEDTIHRMGRWADFSTCYKTLDTPFMESVWWAVAELHKKGLIYQGVKVVPYSTQLQTPLSNFEASSNYQNVQNPAITVLVKLADEESYLAIWTTTPWTLPANLAICIGPYQYVKVVSADDPRPIIVAEDCLARLPNHDTLEIIEKISAEDLVGKAYEPLFNYYENEREQGAFRILLDDYVTTTDGTGLVHCAPAHGEDDYRVCQQAGINIVCPLDEAGCFNEEAPDFQGAYVKDADKAIIKHLKNTNRLYHQDVIVHNYPYCPRTDTPLIYRTIPSWYVKVSEIKDKLLAANQAINWVPEHIKHGRFGKWLENAKDWAISRNRYWGTPIPIWINDQTQQIKCIGSIDELAQLSGTRPTDLHREHVDSITFTLPGEPGTYHRIPEVLDCWFESGSMPFAQLHYPFENQKLFDELFPATFIAEGIDQTRGWFYTLTVLSCALFDKPAFKNVIVNGIVMAEDGKKMSKRLKNYTPPNELLETYGADALRLYLIQSNLVRAEEQRFCDQGVKDIARRILLPWKNAYQFFETYACIDQWRPSSEPVAFTNLLDRWILSRQQTLIDSVNQHMQSYHLHAVVMQIESFLDDLTNTYIRLNRARFWADGMEEDKVQAYTCLDTILQQLCILMAPFTPFLSEKIYQQRQVALGETDQLASIHMHRYPQADLSKKDATLEHGVATMQQILLLGRQARNDAKIKIKTPLQKLSIIHGDDKTLDALKPVLDIIQRELNVKEILLTTEESNFITLYAKVNLPKLGKKLGSKLRTLKQHVENLDHTTIKNYEREQKLVIDDLSLQGDDILVFREPLPSTQALSNSIITIALDTTLNEALIQEGYARELVSHIQKIRKESGFHVSDRIQITLACNPEFTAAIQKHLAYIQQETLCNKWLEGKVDEGHSIVIDQHEMSLALKK